jgi:hypothetical protein
MFCPKCGTDNDDDAKYCEGCGRSLQKGIHEQNMQSKQKNENSGMSNGVKALIVICVVLVAGIGLTAGMLLQNPASSAANNSKQDQVVTTTQSPDTQTYQPTWHKVATFTGSTDDYRTFSIRGNQFKITMSAVPMITYSENSLLVNVFSESGSMVGTGTIEWGDNENPDKKEHVIPVSQGSGTYSISSYAYDLESWTITVWDYY